MHVGHNGDRRNYQKIGIFAAASLTALVLTPHLVSLAKVRPYVFDNSLFTIGPVAAGLVALPVALWGKARARVSFWPPFLVALASLVGAIRPALAGDAQGAMKGGAMALIAGVVPALICRSFGAARSFYILLTANALIGGILVIGSVVLPDALYVPTRETYVAAKLGWFINPNALGAVALSVTVSVYALAADEPWRWVRKVAVRAVGYALLCFCVVALFRSQSRGSIVAACVVPFAGRLIFGRSAGRWRTIVGLMLLAAGVGIGLVWANHQDASVAVLARKHDVGDITGGRFVLWKSVLATWWSDSPLIGGGLTTATAMSLDVGMSGIHNAYLKLLLDLGVLGALLLIALIVRMVRGLWLAAREGWRVHGATAGLIALGLHSLVENHLFALGTTISSVIFWQAVAGFGSYSKTMGVR